MADPNSDRHPEIDPNPDKYPPHIQNHIARLSASKSPPGSASDHTSPSGPSDESTSSRFEFNFDFLKLGGGRNKADGEKPKRRGPKPDSKPALTRRQELNRQAQRTHRERKERYVKSLEEEVVRLREAFTVITKEKTQILEENRRLKELLEVHGIPYDNASLLGRTSQHLQRQEGIDQAPEVARFNRTYDDIGIDFVLALEKPCMEHIQLLTVGSATDPEADFHGHALMASCPPETHCIDHPEVQWGQKTYDMQASDLSVLFNLSTRLQLDGEMTPIAVWATITRHARFAELNLEDFEIVKQELLAKVKCHGFGAVVEEFEVQDALTSLFSRKFGYTY